jgi:energy-coupling factor transporter ATP-binding protein EcfA2
MIQNQTTEYGILTRSEFLELFWLRQEPGQHVVCLGPTGRGKTTLMGQLLVKPPTAGVLIPTLGRPDPALQHLGESATEWPPRMPLRLLMHDNVPFIRRFENRPKQPKDFVRVRALYSNLLRWMFARPGWTIYIPDLQIISDPKMMNLGKEVEQLLLTLRKEASCVFMDAQAPRWIPSAANDQTSHVLIWKNRDRRTRQRLQEIANIDTDLFDALMNDIGRFDFVWVDSLRDEIYHVTGS